MRLVIPIPGVYLDQRLAGKGHAEQLGKLSLPTA